MEESERIASRSVKTQSVQEVVGEFYKTFNNPGSWIIAEAVDIVIKTCSPKAIYIYGPTAKGYVYGRMVNLLVIVDGGDTKKIWDDVTWALTDEFIDGNVSVYTSDDFEEYRDNSYTKAYEAVKTGRLVYAV